MAKSRDPLARLRELCLALPEAHEVIAWGEPTFRVKNKLFAMYAGPHNHHGAGRPGVWVKAEDGAQEVLVAADPERYFRPPYVGTSGWVGVRLDRGVDWIEVRELLGTGWRLVAPPKLLRELAGASAADAPQAASGTGRVKRASRPTARRRGGRAAPRG